MNLKAFALSATLVANAPFAWGAEAADDAQNVFSKVTASVVTVKTLDDNGQPDSHGSGVVVGKGLVATNCHVVRHASAIRVSTPQGERQAEWTHHLTGHDLCLLSVPGLVAAAVVLRDSQSLTVGEPVYAVGNPLGFGLSVSRGLIAVVNQRAPYRLVIATATIAPGSSGGGLFDREGRLLGLTTAILGSGQNMNRILVAEAVASLVSGGESRPPSPSLPTPETRWLEDAQAMLDAGRMDALGRHAQAWHQAQPTSAWALVYLASVEVHSKRYTQAEAWLRQSLALDPDLAVAWIDLADVLFHQSRGEEAEQALQQAELRKPFALDSNIRRADWLEKQGKPELALVQLRQAHRKHPLNSTSWVQVGRMEDALGRQDAAARAFATALRLGSADASVKRRLAELSAQIANPGNPGRSDLLKSAANNQESDAQLAIGWNEFKLGRFGPAEVAIRQALALSPKSAGAWNALAAALRATGRLTQAEDAFSKAIELDPRDHAILVNRSYVRRSLKQADLALADVRAALAISPEYGPAWSHYATLMVDAKNFREASSALAKLNALSPLKPDELAIWGESLLGTGDVEGALQTLRRAEAAGPESAGLSLLLAKALGAKNDIEGALAHITRALALEPAAPVAWSSKGYALLKLGRLPEATEALETAVRLDPELSNSWINLGEAQLRSRNLSRAIQALEKAITLAPMAVDARIFLAQSYLQARLTVKSREQAEKLLVLQPNFVPALGLLTLTYLVEGDGSAATAPFAKLKLIAPQAARSVRDQAIAAGLLAAKILPE